MTDQDWQRAIVENPEDRDIRLVYADWLGDQGQQREEFIRLGFEMHERSGECTCRGLNVPYHTHEACPLGPLIRRSHRLIDWQWFRFLNRIPYLTNLSSPVAIRWTRSVKNEERECVSYPRLLSNVEGYVSRGFVERAVMCQGDWIAKGHLLVRDHPISTALVTLATPLHPKISECWQWLRSDGSYALTSQYIAASIREVFFDEMVALGLGERRNIMLSPNGYSKGMWNDALWFDRDPELALSKAILSYCRRKAGLTVQTVRKVQS